MLTTRKTRFVDPALFKDRNFVAGLVFIFNVGLLLFATLALLPPLLQDLMNYPVVTTGLVTAPRGVGTLIAMVVIARFSKVIDVRIMIASGFALSAFSAWQMSRFDLQMDMYTVIWSGLAQGCGTGMVFVPSRGRGLRDVEILAPQRGRSHVQPVAQSRLEHRHLRGRALAHAQHADGACLARRARHAVQPAIRAHFPGGVPTLQRLSALNAQVTEQAAMIAYNDDFKLMFWLSLAAIPLLLLLRKAGAPRSDEAVVVE